MVREKGILIFRVNTVCQVSVTVALPGYLLIHFLHLHSNIYDTKQIKTLRDKIKTFFIYYTFLLVGEGMLVGGGLGRHLFLEEKKIIPDKSELNKIKKSNECLGNTRISLGSA